MSERPVLLIDGMNVFVRAYVSHPGMDANGEPCGGIVGFLNMLRGIVDRVKPSRVIIAWEGGGSTRRRSLFKEYKQNRRPVKLNRFYEDDIPDSEENKTQQLLKLTKFLRHLKVTQVYVPDCEGDDVIAYLCMTRFRDDRKVIMSSDQDLYQLLDHTTVIYTPGRKIFVTMNDVLAKHGVSVNNFAVAKAICGDGSDNIPGVKGVGFKTLAKRLPELSGDAELSLNDIFQLVNERKGKIKMYDSIIQDEELIRRNLKLMDLRDNVMMSAHQMRKTEGAIDTCSATFDRVGLMRALIDSGIPDYDVDALWSAFRHMMS